MSIDFAPIDAPPPPGDARWQASIERLHRALVAAGYGEIVHVPTTFNPLALPLEIANLTGYLGGTNRRLMEPSAFPGLYRVIERIRAPERDARLGMFFIGEAKSIRDADATLRNLPGAPDTDELVATNVFERSRGGDRVRCRIRFVPHAGLLLVVDRMDRSIPGFTYIGRDSLAFGERLLVALGRRRFGRALDLCCGSGIQGLTVSSVANVVDGRDLNARAIAFASLNAHLAGVADRVQFAVGDLARGLTGPYDLIVANPPYVWMPDEAQHDNLDGFGGDLGLGIVQRILSDLDRLLAPDGEVHMVCEAPVLAGRSALETVAARAIEGVGLRVRLLPLWYAVHRELMEFHRSRGISHIVYYHVRVTRSARAEVVAERLHPVKRVIYAAYTRAARAESRIRHAFQS